MEKVQKIVLDISKENRHEYQPIFCPFTGVMLVSSDILDDIDDFPESVVLVFTEFIEDPYFIAPYFNDYYEKFTNLEDTDEIIKTLNDIEGFYLVLDIIDTASHSGNFGQMIYVLRIPSVIEA